MARPKKAEALNFSAASLLRMGRFEDASGGAEYVDRFPNGERIDTAHLNVIDTLREAINLQRRSGSQRRDNDSLRGG